MKFKDITDFLDMLTASHEKRLPVKPKAPRQLSVDEIIVLYLAEVHHQTVIPQSADIRPGFGTQFLMGATIGGDYGEEAAMAGIAQQQQKASKHAEWLAMKTFAMGQPDFPAYRDAALKKDAEQFAAYELEVLELER